MTEQSYITAQQLICMDSEDANKVLKDLKEVNPSLWKEVKVAMDDILSMAVSSYPLQ